MAKRILMFGWEFPPHNSGGLGTACQGLTNSLVDKGTEVFFVLPKKLNIASREKFKFIFADIPNLKIEEINSLISSPYICSEEYATNYRELIDNNSLQDKFYGKTLLEEVFRYALKAREIAKRENFDVIHAHDWLSFQAGVEAKKASGKPLVAHVHATEYDRGGGVGINVNVYNIEKEGMEMADKVIVVSNFTKEIITKHYSIDSAKIKVVHNGVEFEGHEMPDSWSGSLAELKRAGKQIVLFVGRITLQKGPDYFLKTAKKVLEYKPNVIFIMAGSGDMQRQVLREAADLGISDKMLFTGFIRGKELTKLYQSADLFVMPSVSEPFGITPLESLSNGTPVLISKQSGVSEVLSHALKADFWDVDEMTNQILSVLKHKSLKDTLKNNGENEVKEVTWDKAADKCLDVYAEVA